MKGVDDKYDCIRIVNKMRITTYSIYGGIKNEYKQIANSHNCYV